MKILYFAWLRERLGKSQESFEKPSEMTTVEELIDFLKQKDNVHGDIFSKCSQIQVAVNQEIVSKQHAINDNDEIAFFPPITGG